MSEYKKAFRCAFPYTVPILTGYFFIGIAFGVMFAEKGYSAAWAALMSTLVYAGSAQYLAVNFFIPGFSLFQTAVLILMVNIRQVFYGFSLLGKFRGMGKKRWYMIFALTDETYSLLCTVKVPEGVKRDKFFFAVAMLDQSYWIIGSVIGGILKGVLPVRTEGIEFAMTALFVVIFTEQWMEKQNHLPQLIGLVSALLCLLAFGSEMFVFPAMLLACVILIAGKRKLGGEVEACR